MKSVIQGYFLENVKSQKGEFLSNAQSKIFVTGDEAVFSVNGGSDPKVRTGATVYGKKDR